MVDLREIMVGKTRRTAIFVAVVLSVIAASIATPDAHVGLDPDEAAPGRTTPRTLGATIPVGENRAARGYARRVPFDGAFSPLHWLVIAVVALLVLGPNELPGMARKIGRAVRDLRQMQQQLGAEFGDLVGSFDPTASATPPAGSIEQPAPEDDQTPKETR